MCVFCHAASIYVACKQVLRQWRKTGELTSTKISPIAFFNASKVISSVLLT